MTDGWVIFGSTVGGAVVGGATSTLGSLFVARSEVSREARREMYELLPDYLRADSYTDEASLRTAQDALVVIRNRAVVAGKRERELVEELIKHRDARSRLRIAEDMETEEQAQERWLAAGREHEEVVRVTDTLSKHLERKLERRFP